MQTANTQRPAAGAGTGGSRTRNRLTLGGRMLRPDVPHGEARYRYDFRRPWNDFMETQGSNWVTPHVMRHTFASLLASKGVSIYKIALSFGDDVRVVQKHYAKLLPKDEDIESAFRRERKIRRGETTSDYGL